MAVTGDSLVLLEKTFDKFVHGKALEETMLSPAFTPLTLLRLIKLASKAFVRNGTS